MPLKLQIIFSLILTLFLSGCVENKEEQAKQLELQIAEIHKDTLSSILKEKQKFFIDLDEQDLVLIKLRENLKRSESKLEKLQEEPFQTNVIKMQEIQANLIKLIDAHEKEYAKYKYPATDAELQKINKSNKSQ